VGSDRSILAIKTESGLYLAPDNTVLKYIFKNNPDTDVINVTNADYFLPEISNTFHGRDIFAPVAAHLSLGIPIENLGPPVDSFRKGLISEPVIEEHKITGHISCFDTFGNAVTNIQSDLIKRNIDFIQIGNIQIDTISQTYSNVNPGDIIALFGSSDRLEIAINQGNAKEQLKLQTGEKVTLSY
jgi:S-adenosyl-L-methionine hydrolase (adenosine-forming)